MDSERVSAVITSRNSLNYLKPCFKSLFCQTRPPDEVVLVDRGSLDQSVDAVRQDFPSVQIVQSRRDLGLAKSLNEGIRRTSGDFTLILYAEVQLDRKYLETLLEQLIASGPRVGSASGKIFKMFGGPGVLDSAGLSFNPREGMPGKRGEGAPGAEVFQEQEMVFGAAQCAALYRRRTIDDVALMGKYLDEDMSSDEFDLAWRAQLRGWRSLYVPSATAKADPRGLKAWSRAKAISMISDVHLRLFRNLLLADVQDSLGGLLLSAISGAACGLLTSPHKLLSLPVTAMRLPAARIKRQLIRKNRRVRNSVLGPAGFGGR